MLKQADIQAAVQSMVNAQTWEETRSVLHSQQGILLSTQTIEWMREQIKQASEWPFTQSGLQEHLDLLVEYGSDVDEKIDQKIALWGNKKKTDPHIRYLVLQVLQSSTREQIKSFIQENPEILDPLVYAYLQEVLMAAEDKGSSPKTLTRIKQVMDVILLYCEG